MTELPDRVFEKILIEPNTGHWFWFGKLNRSGYGRVGIDGTQQFVHRYVYEMLVAPIPEGMFIDHQCRVRDCVCPNHLRVVTPAQNAMENSVSFYARRGASDRCERGHLYTDENTIRQKNGARLCRMCRNAYMRELMARKRAAQPYKNPYWAPREETPWPPARTKNNADSGSTTISVTTREETLSWQSP